jgi:phosphotransferase system IIA component
MNAMKLSLLKNFMILDLKVSMELSVEHAKVLIMRQDEEIIMHIGLEDISVKKTQFFLIILCSFA